MQGSSVMNQKFLLHKENYTNVGSFFCPKSHLLLFKECHYKQQKQ